MWSINLQTIPSPAPPPTTEIDTVRHANNVYDFTIQRDIVRYLHRAAGSPVPSTWCTAIDAGNYATWPGLTSKQVRKHLPKSVATTKGHMRQMLVNIIGK